MRGKVWVVFSCTEGKEKVKRIRVKGKRKIFLRSSVSLRERGKKSKTFLVGGRRGQKRQAFRISRRKGKAQEEKEGERKERGSLEKNLTGGKKP